jgi:hypothetical protein
MPRRRLSKVGEASTGAASGRSKGAGSGRRALLRHDLGVDAEGDGAVSSGLDDDILAEVGVTNLAASCQTTTFCVPAGTFLISKFPCASVTAK